MTLIKQHLKKWRSRFQIVQAFESVLVVAAGAGGFVSGALSDRRIRDKGGRGGHVHDPTSA